MANKDLSLSVFTQENYKNVNHNSTNFRNSMYDELEVNKSRFKIVILMKVYLKTLTLSQIVNL